MLWEVYCATLHGLELVSLDDDAELQDELRRALQEGGKQVEHAGIGILVHHPPVEPPAVVLAAAPAPDAQVDGAEIPEEHRGPEEGLNSEELFHSDRRSDTLKATVEHLM